MSKKSYTLLIAAITLLTSSVYGSSTLRLKAGNIDTKQIAQHMDALGVRNHNAAQSTEYAFVQYKDHVTEEHKSYVKRLGGYVVSYVPDNALLIKLNLSAQKILKESSDVQAIVPYLAQLRLSPNLSGVSVFNAFVEQEVVVTVAKGESVQSVITRMQKDNDLKVLEVSHRLVTIKAAKGALIKLAQTEGVEWIEKQERLELLEMPLDASDVSITAGQGDYTNLSGYETGTKVMKFSNAWERGYKGEGQIVAMADTGLDSGDVSTLSDDFVSQVSEGHIFGLFAKNWSDPMGHGTHVAGSVLSKGTASGGEFMGGAHEAQLIAQGMWSPVLNNLTVPTNLKDLFSKAYESGARIHTDSWGKPADFGAYDKNARVTDEFMWENPEMLIIFAAGNSGVDADSDGHIDPNSIGSPGTAKNVLTVGASENLLSEGGIQKKLGELAGGKRWSAAPLGEDKISDNENGMAAFSSIGPTRDGRIKPDIVAPGTNIVSNCSKEDGASPLWGKYNDDYCYSGGTSMSTPLTAGAAAIVRQYLIKEHSIESPTSALVKGVLMNTAFDMFPGQYGTGSGQELATPAPNMNEGYGRVDLEMATRSKGDFLVKVIDHEGLASGDSITFDIAPGDLAVDCRESDDQSNPELATCESLKCSVDSGSEEGDFCISGKLKVTLVYTDAPAAPAAAVALVNNYDLELTIDGKKHSSASELNNSEQITLTDLAQGMKSISIKVIGTNLPETKDGKVPFALIVSK